MIVWKLKMLQDFGGEGGGGDDDDHSYNEWRKREQRIEFAECIIPFSSESLVLP